MDRGLWRLCRRGVLAAKGMPNGIPDPIWRAAEVASIFENENRHTHISFAI